MSEEELMHVCKYCERVLVFDDADTVKELLKRLESKGAIKALDDFFCADGERKETE